MANTETFSKGLMASESVQSYVGSLKFKASGVYADVKDGALVTLGDLAPASVYGDGAVDFNVYEATAPVNDTDPIVIVDLSEVSQGVIAGNNYKMGSKLIGLHCKAGFPARYRVPMKHDKFWVSGDCFNNDPTVGEYGIPTAGTTYITPTGTNDSATKFCIKVLAETDFTVGSGLAGTGRTGKQYLCEVL